MDDKKRNGIITIVIFLAILLVPHIIEQVGKEEMGALLESRRGYLCRESVYASSELTDGEFVEGFARFYVWWDKSQRRHFCKVYELILRSGETAVEELEYISDHIYTFESDSRFSSPPEKPVIDTDINGVEWIIVITP